MRRTSEETLITMIDIMDKGGHYIVSPDGGRVLFVTSAKDGQLLVECRDGESVNGWGFPNIDLDSLTFSPDCQRIAFIVRTDGFFSSKSAVVVDDGEPNQHDQHDTVGALVFCPDGRNVAYVAIDKGKACVIAGEFESKEYDSVSCLHFGPGGVLWFVADADGTATLARGGHERELGRVKVKDVALSLGGGSVAYTYEVAKLFSKKIGVVVDGNDKGVYDDVLELAMAGATPVYVTRNRGKDSLHFGGEVLGPYDRIEKVVVDDASQSACYLAKESRRCSLFVDGERHGSYDEIVSESLRVNAGHIFYVAKDKGAEFTVLDGRESEKYDRILAESIRFEAGRGPIYAALRGKRLYVVESGAAVKEYEYTDAASEPVLSYSGKRVAWVKDTAVSFFSRKQCLMVDGVEGKKYERITEPSITFSADDQIVAYTAHEKEQWAVVLNETEGEKYPPTTKDMTFLGNRRLYDFSIEFLEGGKIVFLSDRRIRYLMGRPCQIPVDGGGVNYFQAVSLIEEELEL